MSRLESIYIDTCVSLYLYEGLESRLSEKALRLIDEKDIKYSPLVSLELKYLEECAKIKSHEKVLSFLGDVLLAEEADINLRDLIRHSIKESWTRDPFDRLIVSHASISKALLITSDKKIQKHYGKALI